MDRRTKQVFIQRVARENQKDPGGARVLWSRQAVAELALEGWKRQQVESALLDCEVIEEYAALHRPFPDCLALAWLPSAQMRIPIHVVVAIDQDRDRILVVTVYEPDEEEWENDWKTRK